MKRLLPAPLIALLLLAPPARAGINLSWDDCGLAGIETQQFACNTNTGTPFTLIGSIAPATNAGSVVGASATIAIIGTEDLLPDWWKVGADACRGTTGLRTSFDFTTGPYTCTDPWLGQAAGAFVYDFPQPDKARLRITCAIPIDQAMTMEGGTQYYVFKVLLGRGNTTGPGACVGCPMPACLLLDEITLWQADGSSILDMNSQDRNVAYWHDAFIFVWDDFEHHTGGIGCAPSGPTRGVRSTWGTLKSLYR